MLFQPPLPPQYNGLSTQEMDRRIRAHKAAFGRRLVILGHHYQQDDVIQYADFTGDSLKLSQLAGQQRDAQYVIFCGVHFMAESADIICNTRPPGDGEDGAARHSRTRGLAEADGADEPPAVGHGAELSRCGTAVSAVGCVTGVSSVEPGSSILRVPSPAERRCHTDEVIVILPDLSAGCSMADMAAIEQLEDAWDHLTSVTNAKIIPITYVNSTAAVKAFVGEHGGACCTSSNARKVLEWALTKGEKVLFLPDQHLGRNTAYSMGYPLESMVVYDPNAERAAGFSPRGAGASMNVRSARETASGGRGNASEIADVVPRSETARAEARGSLSDDQIRDAKFYLWKGHCSVHGLFTEKHVDEIRAKDPECKILVHPECKWEVVQKADLAGSTEYIIKTLEQAPAGTRWAVGTEMHLVNRLAQKFTGVKSIRSLAGMQCLCTTMYRIDQKHLLWCLDELAAGRIVNRIRVDDQTRHWSRVALQRMLENVSPTPVAAK